MEKTILQVEDDENDVLFFRLALQKAGVPVSIQVVRDGKEAISYLSGQGQFSDRAQYPLPCLVLLDLRLPKVPGHEVIRWIRQSPSFHSLVVIVFSSSTSTLDREKAFGSGATSYLVKPTNPAELTVIAKEIGEFWLQGKSPPEPVTSSVRSDKERRWNE